MSSNKINLASTLKALFSGAEYKYIDIGFEAYENRMNELISKKVDVGIQGGTHSDIVNRAFWNEFGTKKIPERSFLRSTLRKTRNELLTLSKEAVKKITFGSSVDAELGRVGLFLEAECKNTILAGNFVPLHPWTIRRKGSSRPLIETGQMIASIRFLLRTNPPEEEVWKP